MKRNINKYLYELNVKEMLLVNGGNTYNILVGDFQNINTTSTFKITKDPQKPTGSGLCQVERLT